MRVQWLDRQPVRFDEDGHPSHWQEQLYEGSVQGYVSTAEGRVSAVVQVGASLVTVDLVELTVARADR